MLCRQETKTHDHLLISCPFMSFLWFKALTELGLIWVSLRSTRDLFAADLGRDLGRRSRTFWVVVVHCLCWVYFVGEEYGDF